MPTLKRRLNLSLPPHMEKTIVRIAKKDKVPLATKTLHLLEVALELHEDAYFDRVATDRLQKKEKTHSHVSAWK